MMINGYKSFFFLIVQTACLHKKKHFNMKTFNTTIIQNIVVLPVAFKISFIKTLIILYFVIEYKF